MDPRSPPTGLLFLSPVLADPDVPPALFHPGYLLVLLGSSSLLGIDHHASDDGMSWVGARRPSCAKRRAQVVDLGAGATPRYRLLYERTRVHPVRPPLAVVDRVAVLDDLRRWSDPVVLLAPQTALAPRREAGRGCVQPAPGGTARLPLAGWTTARASVHVPDLRGFNEPAYAARPTAPRWRTVRGRNEPYSAPNPPIRWANLWAGSGGGPGASATWVAFQNAIGLDAMTRTSSSAVRVLTSADGLDWEVTGEPILAPTGSGWAATHVYAVDVRDTPAGIRLYANGRNAAHWTRGREHVGLAATPDHAELPG